MFTVEWYRTVLGCREFMGFVEGHTASHPTVEVVFLLSSLPNSNAFAIIRHNKSHRQSKSISYIQTGFFSLNTCEGFMWNSWSHLLSHLPSLMLMAQGTLLSGGKKRTWVIVSDLYCSVTCHPKRSWLKITIYSFSQFCGLMKQFCFMWQLLGLWDGASLPCEHWCWLEAQLVPQLSSLQASLYGSLDFLLVWRLDSKREMQAANILRPCLGGVPSITSCIFYWLK